MKTYLAKRKRVKRKIYCFHINYCKRKEKITIYVGSDLGLSVPGGALISPVFLKKLYGLTWTRLGAKFQTSSRSSMMQTMWSPHGNSEERFAVWKKNEHIEPCTTRDEIRCLQLQLYTSELAISKSPLFTLPNPQFNSSSLLPY